MKLNIRILRAINEGVSAALMLDDTNKPAIIRKSSELISNDIKKNTAKQVLKNMLPHPENIDDIDLYDITSFAYIARLYYNEFNITYNPHLDGRLFRTFIGNIIESLPENEQNTTNLNWIDTSEVKDFSYVFFGSSFNGDISEWDVSNATNMEGMFRNSQFNGDISKWDVSNVANMSWMFLKSSFNLDISDWDVSNVTNMNGMFYECHNFNLDLSKWNVSKVWNMEAMFYECYEFNLDLSKWNISKLADVRYMFDKCFKIKKVPVLNN